MKLFTWKSLVYVIKVDFVFASCLDGVLVLIRIKVTFRVNLPLYVIIEQKLKEGIRDNFGNLNVTNNYTLTFQGVFNIIVLSKMHNKSKSITRTNMIGKISTETLKKLCHNFLAFL